MPEPIILIESSFGIKDWLFIGVCIVTAILILYSCRNLE